MSDAAATSKRRKLLIDNFVWLIVSLLLAMIIWVTAKLASDPIIERGVAERIPIQILLDDNVIITNSASITPRAFVVVRAQTSVFEELAVDDIEVIADLRGSGLLGRQTVPLTALISSERRAEVVTISPSQISVELEQRQEKLIPLNTVIADEPPASFEVKQSILSVNQISISGPSSAISSAVSARISLNLAEQRESLELDIRPEVLNADGEVVSGVTIVPETVGITVDIEPRSDVREVRVTPNLVGDLPEGYTLTGEFDYNPETIFVSGPADVLNNLPATFLTAPIDLSNYTQDFDISVPVELPDEGLILITGQRINVFVGINAIQSSRQFENVPVEVIGEQENFDVTLVPDRVTVLLSGPQPVLENLDTSAIQVIIDVNTITEPGLVQLEPRVSIGDGQVEWESISVLPATIGVQITDETGLSG